MLVTSIFSFSCIVFSKGFFFKVVKSPDCGVKLTELHCISTVFYSQSTEDSEPLYDQPHIIPPLSDNERASPSPPPLPNSIPPSAGPDNEIFYRNDNALVKPSMLKEKRSQYAGKYFCNPVFSI